MREQSQFYLDHDKDKVWYLPSMGRDYYHRLDGPAVEYRDGTKYWYVDDKLHRLDGPALEFADGSESWYINGNQLPIREVEAWLDENDINLKTEAGQIAFKLRWS